jgi:DNA polymerase-3 subunit chi
MPVAVAFHTGVPDPVLYAVRLARKALGQQVRLVFAVPPAGLQPLSEALWTLDPGSFLPHVDWQEGTGAYLLRRTPVLLLQCPPSPSADELPWTPSQPPVGVSLAGSQFLDSLPLERRIEVVGELDADREAGQRRWRLLKAAGHPLTHHPYAS